MKIRVLFVCLGNICRSPMAEGILRRLVAGRGLKQNFEIDSAGLSSWHAGDPADPRTRQVLETHSADFLHVARQVKAADCGRYDYIFAMDRENYRELRRLCPEGEARKLRMVLEPLGGGEVPDPYYEDQEVFEQTYTMLERALRVWLDEVAPHAG